MCEKILVSRYINDQKEFPLSEDSIKDIVKYIGRVRFLFIEYKGFKADAVKNVIGTNIPIKQSFTAGMLELKRTDLRLHIIICPDSLIQRLKWILKCLELFIHQQMVDLMK